MDFHLTPPTERGETINALTFSVKYQNSTGRPCQRLRHRVPRVEHLRMSPSPTVDRGRPQFVPFGSAFLRQPPSAL
jgi:hypothetical protein